MSHSLFSLVSFYEKKFQNAGLPKSDVSPEVLIKVKCWFVYILYC